MNSAPVTAVLTNSTTTPEITRVIRPTMPAFGMSLAGLCASSAASGSSSMPR